ncbi:MAG TPA: NYN domain-containing protein, partial [Candidatus Cloacimonetes bacterium]|nr:NYN domain-containing protein [Candidatus Cloacimonadota bacterium]
LTIDALEYSDLYDIGIFITGDSDFLPLITHLRNMKEPKKAYVFSTEGCISHELKTGADGYFDLAKCPEIHGNPLKRRNE